jgi:hypothetical protein
LRTAWSLRLNLSGGGFFLLHREATGAIRGGGILVFLHASAVGTFFPTLATGDGIHSLLQIGGSIDEFGQFLCAPALESDMHMDSASVIHGVSLLVQDADDLDELDDTGFSFEYRGDDFDPTCPALSVWMLQSFLATQPAGR